MSANSLLSRVTEMLEEGISRSTIKRRLLAEGAKPRTIDDYLKYRQTTDLTQAAWREKSRRAGVLHLVDLKRAGHSPRFTELNIPTDFDQPRRYKAVVEVSSYLGSSGAMCAELGK